jgi:hypothetical protein
MRSHGWFLLRSTPALSALLIACGCSLPGNFGVSSEPTPSPTKTGTPFRPFAPSPSANSVAPVTGPGPAPISPLNLAGPESPQDVISLQAQRLNDAVTDHNALTARIAQLEALLQEKESGLNELKDEVAKDREEFSHKLNGVNRRSKQDKDELVERLKKREKEYIELQKENIHLREQLQEQPGAAPKEP